MNQQIINLFDEYTHKPLKQGRFYQKAGSAHRQHGSSHDGALPTGSEIWQCSNGCACRTTA